MKKKKRAAWILYMGTYPPRECGIATFTRDLARSMDKIFAPVTKSKILAINDEGSNIYDYPREVIFQIDESEPQQYIEVAKKINETNAIKLIDIQHEFGIFGGKYGSYLLPFIETVNKPVITTFHTVTPNPDEKLKKTVRLIAEKSACIVVMNYTAVEILRRDYGLIKTDIAVIPHGIPNVSFKTSKNAKIRLGLEDRIILSSFGMMNSGKGYEYVIDALPEIIKKFPNVLYLIIGETHPIVRKKEGERYRNSLARKIKKLCLKNHVKFYNKYVKLSEIIKYLHATDVYVSSSTNPSQIVSGTLSYAMGCGKAVVSTPFLHAKEATTPGRGMLAEFNSPKSFANAIIKILSNPRLKEGLEKEAYSYTRHMTWPNVALAYFNEFRGYVTIPERYIKFPDVKLDHLISLTDDFGIIQFANYAKADIESGYSLDDNARAMIVCCMYHNIFNNLLDQDPKLNLVRTYLDFIRHIQQEDGRFYNFVNHTREIDYEQWSDDSHGRALWALGYLISLKTMPINLRDDAKKLFNKGLKPLKNIKSPRAVAFVLNGLYFYNTAIPSSKNLALIGELADYLVELYKQNSSKDWQWFERYLTYSNSRLPESLFHAYLATHDKKYLETAEVTLEFLISHTFENEQFTPIGQNGWYFKDSDKARFDQQPIEASSMIQALVLANRVTKKERYMHNVIDAFHWFLGKNSINQRLYNEVTGGCHDGLGDIAINLNQGAESTISYLIARLSLITFL